METRGARAMSKLANNLNFKGLRIRRFVPLIANPFSFRYIVERHSHRSADLSWWENPRGAQRRQNANTRTYYSLLAPRLSRIISRLLFDRRGAEAQGRCQQGSADSRISGSLRLSPCRSRQFWATIAVAACLQKVDVYHVKNRRL